MPKNPHISKRQEKKVRKQKIMIAIFGGIFLLLVVIQGPKTLKMMHGGSSSAAPAASTDSSQPSTTTGTSTATSTSTSAVAVTPTASASLDDSDPTPARTKSQLVSFDTFDSKDPFVQQVSAEDLSASSGTTSGSSSPATAAASPATAAAAPAQVVNVPAGDTGSSPATAAAATRSTASVQSTGRTLSSAVLAVNGQRQSVRLSDSFPKANPTFKLVALSGNLARVGIAGGSYASGAQTVALKLGHTLTLVNTADGMRYELKLVSAR